jgi:hypothetical protein
VLAYFDTLGRDLLRIAFVCAVEQDSNTMGALCGSIQQQRDQRIALSVELDRDGLHPVEAQQPCRIVDQARDSSRSLLSQQLE